jgi:hypothetical protein
LGQFFEQRSSFFSFTAMDIYTIANDFIQEQFTNDTVIKELLAIDYYLQQKIKPAEKFIAEIDKKEKFSLLEKYNLPHQKYRYTVIPINFDYNVFEQENNIVLQPQLLFIQYTGTTKPVVVNVNAGALYHKIESVLNTL